jgi:gamma-glutamylaminecyclotransferase
MSGVTKVRVFVYGSLRRGQGNHSIIGVATCVGEARTLRGFTLYDLGPFPALVHGGMSAVVGEVYEVDEPLLARLDRLEGCPRLYQRQGITLEDGTLAYTYVMRLDQVRGRSKIASGNWCEHREERQCRLG